MPTFTPVISSIMEAALFECFRHVTRLVPSNLRPQFILIGGTASVAHSSRRLTEDVDIAASPEAHYAFLEAVQKGARSFRISPDQSIEFDSHHGIPVKLEILHLGGLFVESINSTRPFLGGFVVSPMDLLLLRAVTVADRGNDGDVKDFQWLLELMAEKGSTIPKLDGKRLEVVGEAAKELSLCERLLLLALLEV